MDENKLIPDSTVDPASRRESTRERIKRIGIRWKAIVIALAAGLALVAGIIANLDTIIRFVVGEPKAKAVLETTGIIVDSYRSDYSAVVDFRVLNSGNKIVVINGVIFKATSVNSVELDTILPESAKYDLDISSIRNVGEAAEVTVSHAIGPNEADRFQVKLGAMNLGGGEFRKWGFEISFRTSEGVISAGSIPNDASSTSFVMLPWDRERSSEEPR